MRQAFISLIALTVIFSCGNSGSTRVSSSTQSSENNSDTAKNKSDRHILIQELKKIKETIASNNKETISGIFQFPLSDTAFSIFIDDSTFNEELKSNSNETTKTIFLKYFKEIRNAISIDQVNNLFKYIHVDSLLYTDTLSYNAYIKTEPCFYSYKIEVINYDVILRMDMNSNRDYKSKNNSEVEVPENSGEICEHNFWWVFKFDGNKLNLTNISGAD